MTDSVQPKPTRIARLKGRETMLVCRKCAKKSPKVGKGLRANLKAAMKRGGGASRVRVVETGCLGLCPKGAVAVASAAGLARGDVLLLRARTGADEAVRLLRAADRVA